MNTSSELKNFYKGKKVFVTGHTGFKGAWLCLYLKELGAEVAAYSLPPLGKSLFELSKIENEVTSIIGDIRDQNNIASAINNSGSEILIHMAAQALVRKSYHDPIETYATNVMGTINVLEAIRKSGAVKAVVNITTDKCYENKELDIAFKESDRLGGYDPYSSSKACAEIVTSSWRDSFFAKEGIFLASARAGNVIGGGDFSEDRIIPDILRSIEKNQKVVLRSPKATRPWQHVLEPLTGYLILAMKLYNEGEKFASAYNFGPDGESTATVEDVTQNFIEKIGQGSYQVDLDQNLHEAKNLRLDNNKAKNQLDWKPLLNFDDTINFTAEWYEYYLSKNDIHSFASKQIVQYFKKL